MPACPRCGLDHPPVKFTEWAWAVRDYKPKPPPGQLAVILLLGSRMNAATGCGWASRERLMEDLGKRSKDTVTRATNWAAEHGLLTRMIRGRRVVPDLSTDSLWVLRNPSAPLSGDSSTAQNKAVEVVRARARSRASTAQNKAAETARARDTKAPTAQNGAVETVPAQVSAMSTEAPTAQNGAVETPRYSSQGRKKRVSKGAKQGPIRKTRSKKVLKTGEAAASLDGSTAQNKDIENIQETLDGEQVHPPLTPKDRSLGLARAYAEAEPICRFPAVLAAIEPVVKSGKFPDSQVRDALLTIAAANLTLSLNTLRAALRGSRAQQTTRGSPPRGGAAEDLTSERYGPEGNTRI